MKQRTATSSITGWLMLTIYLACATACGASDAADGRSANGSGGKSNSNTHAAGALEVGDGGSLSAGASGSPNGGFGGGRASSGNAGSSAAGTGASVDNAAGGGSGGAAGDDTGGNAGRGGAAGSAGKGSTSDMLVPASGALLGQYYGDGDIAQTAAKLGRTLPVHLTYWAWDDDWTSGGRIPLVNREPADIDFRTIVDGSREPPSRLARLARRRGRCSSSWTSPRR